MMDTLHELKLRTEALERMMDTLHELKLHTEALEKSLKIARNRIDSQDEYIMEIQDDLNHVSFKYSCLCAKLHFEKKNKDAVSRN